VLESFAGWAEATTLASTIRESTLLTGALSSCHLIGLALITSGALFSNLAPMGYFTREYPRDAIRPALRLVTIGFVVSLLTGVLLFAPRATTAVVNSTFRLKMTLLVLGALLHVTLLRAAGSEPADGGMLRAGRALALALWVGVGLAGCAFILLE
jgi:hypothetical protein